MQLIAKKKLIDSEETPWFSKVLDLKNLLDGS